MKIGLLYSTEKKTTEMDNLKIEEGFNCKQEEVTNASSIYTHH